MSRPPYNYGGPSSNPYAFSPPSSSSSRPTHPTSSSGKRKAPAYIEIPSDDGAPSSSIPTSKRKRPSTGHTAIPGPSTQLDLDYEDDAGAHDVIDLSQDDDREYGEDWEHYGHIDGKVVGVRYYNGIATVGEQVLLKREPTNQVCLPHMFVPTRANS